jgi:DNA-binding MarR family transcriptional regulator
MSRTPDAQVEIRIEDLAMLVASLSRFLTRLSNMRAFRDSGLGLAEWSTLSIIAGRRNVNSRQLANITGVSVQRINQITASLKQSGLILLKQDTEDARKKILTITPAGSALLKELDAHLLPIMNAAFNRRPMALTRARRMISGILMRMVQRSPEESGQD